MTKRGWFGPWQVVLVTCVAYVLVVFALNDADPRVFVTIGDCYAQCSGPGSCTEADGYDGQFAYYIAREPFTAAPCIDVPAYRYQRILLPAAATLVSVGVDSLIPLALVLVNLVALVGSTALLQQLLTDLKVSRWYALVYGLFIGVFMSVRLSTTEPLAYGLVIAAIYLREIRERPLAQAGVFVLAMLAKETTLIFVAAYLLFYLLERRWRDLLPLGFVVGSVFILWQGALWAWLGSPGVGSGGAAGTSFEIIPFNGYWRIAYDAEGSIQAFLVLSLLIFPAAVLPTIWALWASGRELLRGKRHVYTCMAFMNALVIVFLPFSTFREWLGLVRFIVGLVLSVLLYAALRYPRGRPLRYATLWIVLILYVVAG